MQTKMFAIRIQPIHVNAVLSYSFLGLLIFYDNSLQCQKITRNDDKHLLPNVFAGLVDRKSEILLCSGSLLGSRYILTDCRCFYSYVIIHPHFRKRLPSMYKIILSRGMDEEPVENDVMEFVSHPYCMSDKVQKPYKNHFGLAVLKHEFLSKNSSQPYSNPIDVGRWENLLAPTNMMTEDSNCHVTGFHVEYGKIIISSTRMVLMKTDDCLFRLCIPKIGCEGKKDRLLGGMDFCLLSIQVSKRSFRFLPGSSVTCRDMNVGIIISTGEQRYSKIPTIFAYITQYLETILIPKVNHE